LNPSSVGFEILCCDHHELVKRITTYFQTLRTLLVMPKQALHFLQENI